MALPVGRPEGREDASEDRDGEDHRQPPERTEGRAMKDEVPVPERHGDDSRAEKGSGRERRRDGEDLEPGARLEVLGVSPRIAGEADAARAEPEEAEDGA